MGYYINVLQEGKLYELNGLRLEYLSKRGKLFYFYIYKLNEDNFLYEKTDMVVSYSSKDLTYIKRVQECSPIGMLKRIGRDKVFARF